MNPTTVLIGVAAIGVGIYFTCLRATNSPKLGKLEAMKKQWGDGPGTAIHVIAYTILPIVFGIVMIVSGLKGVSFFGV